MLYMFAGKAAAKAIIEDTRSAHFNFGSEKIEYLSDSHRYKQI